MCPQVPLFSPFSFFYSAKIMARMRLVECISGVRTKFKFIDYFFCVSSYRQVTSCQGGQLPNMTILSSFKQVRTCTEGRNVGERFAQVEYITIAKSFLSHYIKWATHACCWKSLEYRTHDIGTWTLMSCLRLILQHTQIINPLDCHCFNNTVVNASQPKLIVD